MPPNHLRLQTKELADQGEEFGTGFDEAGGFGDGSDRALEQFQGFAAEGFIFGFGGILAGCGEDADLFEGVGFVGIGEVGIGFDRQTSIFLKRKLPPSPIELHTT
jgi:hypothetical protein